MINSNRPTSQTGHDNFDASDRIANFLANSERSFPNIVVSSLDADFRGEIRSRNVAGHPISRLKTTGLTAHASRRRGADAGFKGWAKLVWQIAGGSTFDNADASFELAEGDAVVLPMSEPYQLTMREGFDGIMMIFDPSKKVGWSDFLHREIKPISGNAVIAAAGAATACMLENAVGDASDSMAIEFALDAMLHVLVESDYGAPNILATSRLRRAAWLIEQNLSAPGYTATEMARELGISRRALYQEFASVGLSPARLAKRMRLDRAKQEILLERDVSLTDIALRNGFPDSSSFSHAFKKAFGTSPSKLRAKNR